MSSPRMERMPHPGSRIAEGSMAELFQTDNPEQVLKLSRRADFNATLLQEAQLSRKLHHPALLPVLDFGLDEAGRAWLLLPRLSGETLDTSMASDLAEELTPVADALDLLHHEGWIHGDLKPQNLLRNRSGEGPAVLLSDLGLARKQGTEGASGSPAYLSPSRLKGEALNFRDDLHAFTVLVFECLAGCLPWQSARGEELMESIAQGRIQSLEALRPDLPPDLSAFLERSLRKNDSWSSMMEWMDGFRRCLSLDPAPRTLFFCPAAHPDSSLLSRCEDWLRRDSSPETRLGPSILLEGEEAEASLLQARVSGVRWREGDLPEGRKAIAWMEAPVGPEGAVSAVFATESLSRETADYLRHRADCLLLHSRPWSEEEVRGWLEASLTSVSRKSLTPGHEELRFLLEHSHGRPGKLLHILEFLLSRHFLREELGMALFAEGRVPELEDGEPGEDLLSRQARDLHAGLRSLPFPLREEEIRELFPDTATGALGELKNTGLLETRDGFLHGTSPGNEEAPFLSPEFLDTLWGRSDSASRLQVLNLALRQGSRDWLKSLPSGAILHLGDSLPSESLAEIPRETEDLPHALLSFLGRLVRGNPEEARQAFWHCEAALDLESSAEILRRLLDRFFNEKSLEEGFAILEQWKQRREKEIEGSRLEIRVAAREVVSWGKFGSPALGRERLSELREQFSGREGLWFLDWAESLLDSEQLDYAAACDTMSRALKSAEGEADPGDLFSLRIHRAELLIVQNRFEEGLEELEIARRIAVEVHRPEFLRYVSNSLGLFHLGREDFVLAEEQFRLSLRRAREAGLWREPTAARNNRVLSLLYQGDYGRLLPALQELERHCQMSERLSDVLAERKLLVLSFLETGELDRANHYIEEGLAVARETGSLSMEGYFLFRRGRLWQLLGEKDRAQESLREALRIMESRSPDKGFLLRVHLGELDLSESPGIEELREGMAELGSGGRRLHLPRAGALMARKLHGEGRRDESRKVLQQAREDAEILGNPEWTWPLHLCDAELSLADGDRVTSLQQRGLAIEILRDLSRSFPDDASRQSYLSRPDRLACLELS
ncbi:MAG: protein kinase [Candidatus Krumholzibacteria bacterium]|nr:protein kinase [Candidatus Krumholzibacteria bacterium]